MKIKRYALFIITSFLLIYGHIHLSYGKANKYLLLRKSRGLFLYRNNKRKSIDEIPFRLLKDDVLLTRKDSSAIVKINNRFVKIYPYSKLTVKDIPYLVYGKFQISNKEIFSELHFTVYPSFIEGKTFRILLWGFYDNTLPSGKIETVKGAVQKIHFYRVKGSYYKALIGLPLGTGDKRYIIKINFKVANNYTLIKYPFYMKKLRYKRGLVRLTPIKKELLLPSEKKKEEQEALQKILENSSSRQYWRGRFIYPLKEHRIISDFGKKRKYYVGNNFLFQHFHNGIDLYGKRGTEIFAPNSGVIVFAGHRITTGNTIVIDHGLGVFSLFFHLSHILIGKGNFVGKGCLIGKVGSTGLAESPHLHWGVLVNMVYVNPVQWTRYKF